MCMSPRSYKRHMKKNVMWHCSANQNEVGIERPSCPIEIPPRLYKHHMEHIVFACDEAWSIKRQRLCRR